MSVSEKCACCDVNVGFWSARYTNDEKVLCNECYKSYESEHIYDGQNTNINIDESNLERSSSDNKMVNCKACTEEISKEAKECPKCGQPNKQVNTFSSIIYVVFFVGLVWFFFGGGLEKQATKDLVKIQNKVANDFVKQYNIAKRQGDAIQICIQAGLVTAGFLQANDENNYRKWKSIERRDCASAGL